MNKLMIIALASSTLAGCATYETADNSDLVRCKDGSFEYLASQPPYCKNRGGVAGTAMSAYAVEAQARKQADRAEAIQELTQTLNQFSAQIQQNTQNLQNQTGALRALEVQQVRQPDGTTWVYCRAATDRLYHCRTY